MSLQIEPKGAPPRVELTAAGDAVAKDEFGNALGGIRSLYVDVHVAQFSGENSSDDEDVRFLFGSPEMLDDTTLQSHYPTHNDYVSAVTDSAHEAVAQGFLLSEDAAIIINATEANDIPPQP